MNNSIEVRRTDSAGDTFVTGYNQYLKGNAHLGKYHLEAFIDSYERCFGEQPTPEQLDNAFRFVDMFFGEISECYPRSQYAEAVSRLAWMVGDSAVTTAENLASLAPKITN